MKAAKGKPRFIHVKETKPRYLRLRCSAAITDLPLPNTHLSFVPGFNLAQTSAREEMGFTTCVESTGTRAIVLGDSQSGRRIFRLLPHNGILCLSRRTHIQVGEERFNLITFFSPDLDLWRVCCFSFSTNWHK
jgi:hypothetical protein